MMIPSGISAEDTAGKGSEDAPSGLATDGESPDGQTADEGEPAGESPLKRKNFRGCYYEKQYPGPQTAGIFEGRRPTERTPGVKMIIPKLLSGLLHM